MLGINEFIPTKDSVLVLSGSTGVGDASKFEYHPISTVQFSGLFCSSAVVMTNAFYGPIRCRRVAIQITNVSI